MQRRTYDCSKFGLAVSSFALRPLAGHDERAAIARAGEDARRLEVREQLIADAICQVDGEDVITPYVKWSSWDARTRSFVRAAFNDMQSATEEEIKKFLATARDGLFDARGLGLAFRESIKLKAPTGHEELAAVRDLGQDATAFDMREALVGAAIVEVDTESFPGPSTWSGWDLRTRAFVQAAHDHVTGASQEEIDDFLQGAREADAPPARA